MVHLCQVTTLGDKSTPYSYFGTDGRKNRAVFVISWCWDKVSRSRFYFLVCSSVRSIKEHIFYPMSNTHSVLCQRFCIARKFVDRFPRSSMVHSSYRGVASLKHWMSQYWHYSRPGGWKCYSLNKGGGGGQALLDGGQYRRRNIRVLKKAAFQDRGAVLHYWVVIKARTTNWHHSKPRGLLHGPWKVWMKGNMSVKKNPEGKCALGWARLMMQKQMITRGMSVSYLPPSCRFLCISKVPLMWLCHSQPERNSRFSQSFLVIARKWKLHCGYANDTLIKVTLTKDVLV